MREDIIEQAGLNYVEIEFPKDESNLYVLDKRKRILVLNLSTKTYTRILE